MTISRIKPAGWAANEKLTSVQITNVDVNGAKALDKTIAGDTLSGAIAIAATGAVKVSTAGASVEASNAGVISATGTGKIRTKTAAGLQLGGGSTDWPTFTDSSGTASARTRTLVKRWDLSMALEGEWSWVQTAPIGIFTTVNTGAGALMDLPVHDGSTISTVTITFSVGDSHAGGAPGTATSFNVVRLAADGTLVSLRAAGVVTAAPASGAAWYNAGASQTLVFTCDQNNVVNRSLYTYSISLIDEFGANAAAGNIHHSATIAFTAIADMRFQ